jgi:hypothetical protein
MALLNKLRKLLALRKFTQYQQRLGLDLLTSLPNVLRGFDYAQRWQNDGLAGEKLPFPHENKTTDTSLNPFKKFFDSRETGRGIWKWTHYFDAYHRHFNKFIGSDVHVLEIGIYSGGSLEMWRDYFGPKSHIYGVDIQAECKCYENEHTKIFIGDQGDREFWRSLKKNVPTLDILIDDGGHKTEQQIITLEEMLPHLRAGGVYLCEDIHGKNNGFPAYLSGIVKNLNAHKRSELNHGYTPTNFQKWINSAHFYPYITVLEKNSIPMEQFIDPKHGSEWQPFL